MNFNLSIQSSKYSVSKANSTASFEDKFKALFSKTPYSMYENHICCDYRDGKVTKEELDKCSTCDVNCVINNGLSEASKEQLKHKSGEQIVDEDIAKQME